MDTKICCSMQMHLFRLGDFKLLFTCHVVTPEAPESTTTVKTFNCELDNETQCCLMFDCGLLLHFCSVDCRSIACPASVGMHLSNRL